MGGGKEHPPAFFRRVEERVEEADDFQGTGGRLGDDFDGTGGEFAEGDR